jgi:lysyl-tRNA synthetase, class II
MRFTISPKILDDFPGLRIGIVVAHAIKNSVNASQVVELLNSQQSAFNAHMNKSLLADHPFIAGWHEVYKKFGAKPKEHLSSVENLSTRIVKGGTIAPINTLVDLYNTVSLKYMLPIGGEDLDAIAGDIALRYATADEKAVRLLGEKEERIPVVGEVIYADDRGAMCRRFNWKQADRTQLTEQTKNAIFIIEALPCVDTRLLEDALNELASLINQHCGGLVTSAILDKDAPDISIKHGSQYEQLQPYGSLSAANWNVYEIASTHSTISQETELRIAKIADMQAEGISAWPQARVVSDHCAAVIEHFGTDRQQSAYGLSGRVMSMRLHGKTAFADIQDVSGRLQIYIRQDLIDHAQFEQLKKFIDIGDIIFVHGSAFRTKMGEITLEVSDFSLLSKCIHPLPEKFHGIADVEIRYRQRYLDLITNAESKQKFLRRSLLIRAIRTFLDTREFLEVETPMLHPIAGGAAARPFITHHNALDSDFYLRIAPELYLKRLVIGGFERVYEINRNFRNEGVSTRHNPEFTMLEFYMAHKNYHDAMNLVEELLRAVIQNSCGTLQVPFGSHIIDFSTHFKRISIRDSVLEIGGLSAQDITQESIDATLKKHGIVTANRNASLGEKIYALFEALVESKLIQPTFAIDFPIEVSPLAKRDPDNSSVAARFELFIAGMEISNGFNELNDPFDQAERFKQQLQAHKAGDEEAHQYDADYIKALEYGLPPTAGVGIGIDRLIMLATNTTTIKDVILFPTLKKK